MVKILGHRGIRQPENQDLPYQNTMEAFRYSIEKGADGFELDVVASTDGKCFVIHDDDISMHGSSSGFITQLSSVEIKTKKVGINKQFDIPTLTEVLTEFAKKNALINIEIKQENIAELVHKEIKAAKFPTDKLIVSSFKYPNLTQFRNLDKEIKIGVLFGKESKENPNFQQYITDLAERLEPSVFCMEKTLPYISVLESKKDKYFWTIRKEDLDNFVVDGLLMYENVHLITDYPEELINKIGSLRLKA